ncbi:PDR/VanB family oxidoreductase [Yinghuangia seranimata]|uniref:PDR/VanB family oxidoreductase n=1 Tax=Yinghuangia seranimata TaxID=408067 RepID=UPI00248B2631|nr:PDR/VanB family oxidoreductase [Yinghuangia seranimata]MDI2127035.1 PDR/VanB family oxidoreductase [Yinghuangia seranimata]
MDLVVRAARVESDGVRSLDLVSAAGERLPAWTPGAHIDLVLGEGPDALVRQYSLCGDAASGEIWRIAVLRTADSRGGSQRVHDDLRVGDVVKVRGPRNHFALAASPRYLFIAGGIGITPILPMVAEAEAAGADWRLVYGGRTRSAMAFVDRLAPYGAKVTLAPQDEVGYLDLDALLGAPEAGTLVYCCGPEGLLDAVEARCAAWPQGALRIERFTPIAVDDTGNREFTVVLKRSGLTLTVPRDKSIYAVCRENDVSPLASCLEGICGTCETEVLEGEVEHRDAILDEAERAANTSMMICVSRCRGDRLTLDL